MTLPAPDVSLRAPRPRAWRPPDDWPWRIALGSIIVVAVLVLVAVVERVTYRGDVLPGVTVDGVPAGGHSEARVLHDIAALARTINARTVHARAGTVSLTATARRVGLRLDLARTLRAARHDGRSRNPIDVVAGVVLRRLRNDHIPIAVTYEANAIDNLLDQWQRAASKGVRDAAVQISPNSVTVLPPTSGTGIDIAAARRALTAALVARTPPAVLTLKEAHVDPAVSLAEAEQAAAAARRVLTGSYTVHSDGHTFTITSAQLATALGTRVGAGRLELTIDADRLGRTLEPQLGPIGAPAVPASFDVHGDLTVSVVPSSDGRGPDLAAAGRAILAGHRTITVGLAASHPVHDTAWAQRLGITEMVSTFTTHHPCCAARVQNIHRAADLMNNTVIEPGQIFSLNGVVGPRTIARGFAVAPVYYGEFTEDVGGGVSQISTTTFNAAWWGGFDIVEHQPHTIYFDRYPMGREATVNYPYLDLRWRNNSQHGVLVRTSYTDTSITVTLFGNREGKVVKEVNGTCRVGPETDTANDPRCIDVIATVPIVRQVVPCPAKHAADDPTNICATLKAGEQDDLAAGHAGYTVRFYREITQPGKPLAREQYYWHYDMLPDVVLVGAGTPPPTTTVPGATTTTTTPGGVTTTTG